MGAMAILVIIAYAMFTRWLMKAVIPSPRMEAGREGQGGIANEKNNAITGYIRDGQGYCFLR
jgi:hypothetical protein